MKESRTEAQKQLWSWWSRKGSLHSGKTQGRLHSLVPLRGKSQSDPLELHLVIKSIQEGFYDKDRQMIGSKSICQAFAWSRYLLYWLPHFHSISMDGIHAKCSVPHRNPQNKFISSPQHLSNSPFCTSLPLPPAFHGTNRPSKKEYKSFHSKTQIKR